MLVILLFGANKLPGLARNMGKSMRIFKSEVEEMRGDEKRGDDEDESDRPARSDRARDDREYDPRDREIREDRDRETVRAPREDDEPYRRD
ncbi:twin-arginine translocase TatA/TatE family subunit [Brachybacterium sp. GPGPB12]|uniref:twin-arginine translocase TatA/TatE family subunit n=1 Tax=Brachybacterium sp. GPGPB12 TaxID=3023517 RepID=UPI0031343EC8